MTCTSWSLPGSRAAHRGGSRGSFGNEHTVSTPRVCRKLRGRASSPAHPRRDSRGTRAPRWWPCRATRRREPAPLARSSFPSFRPFVELRDRRSISLALLGGVILFEVQFGKELQPYLTPDHGPQVRRRRAESCGRRTALRTVSQRRVVDPRVAKVGEALAPSSSRIRSADPSVWATRAQAPLGSLRRRGSVPRCGVPAAVIGPPPDRAA